MEERSRILSKPSHWGPIIWGAREKSASKPMYVLRTTTIEERLPHDVPVPPIARADGGRGAVRADAAARPGSAEYRGDVARAAQGRLAADRRRRSVAARASSRSHRADRPR